MNDFVRDLKVLFFDVGNVFVSDDPSGCHCYKELHDVLRAAGETEEAADFFARRLTHFRNGGGLWSFAKSHTELLPNRDFHAFQQRVRAELYSRWPELSPEIPGMADAVRELARHYRLGLIANQPPEIVPLLEQRGLLELFEIHGVSGNLGTEKPDPQIFRWALERAGVPPQQTLMIGDRIDNDVRPAKALGMRTLWLRLGHEARGWRPRTEFERHYESSILAGNFSELEPQTPEDQPDLVARTPRELVQLLTP